MRTKQRVNRRQISILVATLILGILTVRMLFIKPVIGMADNGDFFREIHNVGLYYLSDSFEDRHFGYFNKLFGIRQYPFEKNTGFVSSLSLLIRGAVATDKLFTHDFVFDIRWLAAFYTAAFLVAFYVLLKNLSEGIKLPVVVVAAAAILIFGDVGYISYFNSFYGEPASYVFLFLMLASIFRIIKKEKPTVLDFLGFALCALVFVGAKQQNSPIAVLIAIVCVRMLLLRKDRLWRTVIASCTAVILIVSSFVYLSITDDIKHINQYHALTRGILQNSKDTEKDVEELGLDRKYSLLAGTTYYDKYSLEHSESELMNTEFYPEYGFGGIVKFYLTHMDRLIEKLDIAARNGFSIRPKVIGNYEKAENLEYGKKAGLFSLWSTAKEAVFPKSFKFIVFFYAAYYAVLLKLYIGRLKNGDLREKIKLEVFAMVGLIGLIQFGVSFVGAGDADMAKHLFLFDVCFDFMFVSGFVFIANAIYVRLGIEERAGGFLWKRKSLISG